MLSPRKTDKEADKPAATQPKAKPAKARRHNELRDTFESIVIAFVLAFLFRTFEAEAFVIPTGSMAPTLRGRHKEVDCQQCGYHIVVGASEEVDNNGYFTGPMVEAAICPNCRYENSLKGMPVYKGDRILVNKFPYEIGEPKRWDVMVFKYPEEPATNYIKRLIGLPGETLEIRQGDVYRHQDEPERLVEILRKNDPYKQRELQLLVHDNDYASRVLLESGWPERWAAVERNDAPGHVAGWSETDQGWQIDAESRSFRLDFAQAKGERLHWLRYRHFVPNAEDWRAAENDPSGLRTPRPELITDFCGYNATDTGRDLDSREGLYWVGDLTLSATVEIEEIGADGELVFELNEGARKYRVRFDLETGQATLAHTIPANRDEDEEEVLGTAQTGVRGPGEYRITFANVDDRLSVWVDAGGLLEGDGWVGGEKLIDFGEGAAYKPYMGLPRQQPQEADLIPAGIAARGLSARVSHLLLERDIYYRAEFLHPGAQRENGFDAHVVHEYAGNERELQRLVHDPERWYMEYDRGLSANQTEPGKRYAGIPFTFTLADGEFFAMGDNSPRSKDSRLWSNVRGDQHRHAVPRDALVGKAFFIYWPHGIPFLNDGKGYALMNHKTIAFENRQPVVRRTDYPEFRIPFYPDVTRMRRIR